MSQHETQVTGVTVRYWASARAAAGVDAEFVELDEPITLAALRETLVDRHPDPRLGDVLQVCSVLLGDQPVGRGDPAAVLVRPGTTVEFLPPFAGG